MGESGPVSKKKMKEYSTIPKAPRLKPQHQMLFSIISRTFVRGWALIPLQKCR